MDAHAIDPSGSEVIEILWTSEAEEMPSTTTQQNLNLSTGSASSSNSKSSVVNKQPVSWTSAMEVMLMREVNVVNPCAFKERTKERGKAWDQVARNMVKHGHTVTKRAVRDKFKSLKDMVVKRNSRELRESGIAPELTDQEIEVTAIVEDLTEVEKETKERQACEEIKKQGDGVEMRKRALETFAETNKRMKSEKDGVPRKRRNTGTNATEFMVMKFEAEKEMKERDFKLREVELERNREKEERELEQRRQDEARREERERREEERNRRDEERRRRDEERRNEKEQREEERKKRDDVERERRWELFQQQLLQQNQMMMMILKNQQKE